MKIVAGNNTVSRASRIDFWDGNSSSANPQWTLISNYGQAGTDDFSIVNNTASTSNARVFNILQSGNVGINTITPQNRLNVIGDINATGTVYANGVNLSALTSSGGMNGSGTYGYIPMWNSTTSFE